MNKYIRFKDQKRRAQIVSQKFNKYPLKYLSLKRNLLFNLKFKTMLKLQSIAHITKIKNRCLLSNYTRAFVKFTKTSKTEFRKSMGLGLVTGFKKSS